MRSSRPLGLYVHVPFCLSKCVYCDFYSCPGTEQEKTEYIEALCQEASLRGQLWAGAADTVFFGGGTPSCLNTKQIATVLRECGRYFPLYGQAEVSLEVNPGTLTGLDFECLRGLGINRLSIGLQATQDSLLRTLGRVHTRAMFEMTCAEARRAGFDNLSADVMYGLPGQRIADYAESIAYLRDMGIDHVSCYALQLEEGTPLCQRVAEGIVVLPEEDEVLAMYETGRDMLRKAGYEHYEISNFARPGRECRHNLKYWRNEEYVGLGPSAAGFVDGRRYVNIADTEGYIRLLAGGLLPIANCESLPAPAHRSETAILALRLLREGLVRDAYIARYGTDPFEEYAEPIQRGVQEGLLRCDGERVVLTDLGAIWANRVQSSFLVNP